MNPVICGVDEWDTKSGSAGAVQLARQLARRFQRPLLLVTVIKSDADKPTRAAAEALLRHTIETSSDVDASWTVEEGHPAERLVGIARERKASFVVLGNHGPQSSLHGSVSANVSRHAPCPVVVVPRSTTPREAEHWDRELEPPGGIV